MVLAVGWLTWDEVWQGLIFAGGTLAIVVLMLLACWALTKAMDER